MDEIEISSLVDKVDRKQMVLPEMLNDCLSWFQAQGGRLMGDKPRAIGGEEGCARTRNRRTGVGLSH